MVLRKKSIIYGVIIILFVLISIWIWYGNNNLEINEIEIIDEKIPEGFDNFKIAQLSDLHSATLGKDNEKIIKKLKDANADIIVITGDFIDSRRTDVDVCLSLAEKLVKMANVYYVTGNHEARVKDDYKILRDGLTSIGVNVMENEYCDIEKDGEYITLIGLHDTGFDFNTGIDYTLNDVRPDNDNYKILLAHRPEYFDKYIGVDLIFSGHAHGGQIRLPFVGGLFAPGQGVLPKYDAGIYKDENKTMVVSRGIGNSLFPFRVNNNPEIVVVTLEKKI